MKQNKYGLALHTTTTELGLALIDVASREVKIEVKDVEHGLMNHLHVYLKEFLGGVSWHDLAFIGVAKGPGSFTSTRIGMVTARTLAQQLAIPLLPLSSLAVLAQDEANKAIPEMLIAVQVPAGHNKYYVAIYERLEGKEVVNSVLGDTIKESNLWQEELSQLDKPYVLVEGNNKLGYTVGSLLRIAYALWLSGESHSWDQALPFYQAASFIEITTI